MKILIFIACMFLAGCSGPKSVGAMVVSISSDGKYVVTSGMSKKIILWDIGNKTKKIISNKSNIYSVYFVKHSNKFMWQDLDNVVHVQAIDGKKILSFHNFPTYGEVMTSDLKNYFASDVNWTIFEGYGKNQKQMKMFCGRETDTFIGIQKLFNLTLSEDNQYLLSSGETSDSELISDGMCAQFEKGYETMSSSYYNGTTLWRVKDKKPLYKFQGLVGKSFGTISPDGNYIIGADEDNNAFVWDSSTGKKQSELNDLLFGRNIKKANCHSLNVTDCYYWDQDGIIEMPEQFKREYTWGILSLKFIDLNGDYLRFQKNTHYAVLFNVKDRRPIKYLYLGRIPEIVTTAFYDRDDAIDTAPAANILVIGKKYTTGIIVYKYDPKTQTLKEIWSPNLYSLPREWWEIFKNSFLGGFNPMPINNKSNTVN